MLIPTCSLNKDWHWIKAIKGEIRQAMLCRTRADCWEVSGRINIQSIHSTLLGAGYACVSALLSVGCWASVWVSED